MNNLLASSARGVISTLRRSRAAKARRPPPLRTGQAAGTAPRIYYLSPDPGVPRGGVRVIYRHVDLLNQAGLAATVIHHGRGYRAGWFPNATAVAAAADVLLRPGDLLVVPEFYAASLDLLPRGVRVVTFNQGVYYTFVGAPPERAAGLAGPPVEAILTISQDSLELLRFTFEQTPVHYARSVIDADLFHPAEAPGERRRIAFATSRREPERHQLLSMLAARGRIDAWELVPIRGMSEAEVADTLRRCAIFLSFSERDGFGLPPAEAMASGCYVIGYHGQGGKEFFDPAYCRPIPDNDLLAFATAVEAAAASFDEDPEQITQAGLAASRAILGRYQLDGLRSDLLEFYRGLGITPPAAATPATAAPAH